MRNAPRGGRGALLETAGQASTASVPHPTDETEQARCAPRGPEDMKAAARSLGYRVADLCVLTPQLDPFMSGGPADQQNARWFAETWRRFEYARAHMRRMHYQIVSNRLLGPDGKPYENTERASSGLYRSGSKARDLDLVDPLHLDDRRNPEPILHAEPREGETPEPSWEWIPPEDMQWHVPTSLQAVDELAWWPSFPTGSIEVDGYDWSPGDAPVLCEVWIEKTTQDDVLVPVCRRLGVNLVRFAGYGSEIHIAKMLARARTFGGPVRIFYISDFDPAGNAMHTAVARNIEFYRDRLAPESDIALQRIALTREQVDHYDLPRIPIKDEDLRKRRFEEVNGEGAVELDALEALHPGELGRIVEAAIEPYRDPDLSRRLMFASVDAKRAARTAFREATEDIDAELDEIRDEIREVATAAQERLRPIDEEYERRIEPIRRWYAEQRQPIADELQREVHARLNRLSAVRDELDETVSDLRVSLPDRPQGEWRPADDEHDWLYRSDRDWLDQLRRYHREQGRTIESRTRPCAVCGEMFTPPRSDGLYCSKPCRDKGGRLKKAAP